LPAIMATRLLQPRVAAGVSMLGAIGYSLHSCSDAEQRRPSAIRKVLSSVQENIRVDSWYTDELNTGLGRKPWSVAKRTLHGGRQEGVDIIEVDNGAVSFSVIPTRGMSIGYLDLRAGGASIPLGWQSPVTEVVHPREVDLQDYRGLGWLTGFNEFLVRCGVAFAGHPAEDEEGRLRTLHGRIGNIPASEVEVVVEEEAPHRIIVRGKVAEQMFKFSDFELWTEVSTEPGSHRVRVSDVLVNRSSYEREYQMVYHANFGPPILEAGSRFHAAVAEVVPFNETAAAGLPTWREYLPPTAHFGEQVYNVTPRSNRHTGYTTVALVNSTSDRGVALRYKADTLPCFTLWKNTDTMEEGYVTGLEPGTGFCHPRAIERAAGRIPTLAPGASVVFDVEYEALHGAEAVQGAKAEICQIAVSHGGGSA